MDAASYLRSLSPLAAIAPLDASTAFLQREAVLAAEVSLPLAQGVDVAALRWVLMRPPHARDSRVLLVDASRLSAA